MTVDVKSEVTVTAYGAVRDMVVLPGSQYARLRLHGDVIRGKTYPKSDVEIDRCRTGHSGEVSCRAPRAYPEEHPGTLSSLA